MKDWLRIAKQQERIRREEERKRRYATYQLLQTQEEKEKELREKQKQQQRAYYQRHKAEIRARQRERYEKDPEFFKRRQRNRRYMRKYGMTVDEVELLYSRGCEICGAREMLCVDHCHKTGKVRGCLCSACNTAIGCMRETPELLMKAIEYVTRAC